MTCDDLARTGTDLPWVALLVALVLLVVGVALVRRARPALAILLFACVLATAVTAHTPEARAACPPTTTLPNSLTITHTSTNAGMAPWRAPSTIVGLVTNNGPDEAFVTAIVVTIGSVRKAVGAPGGPCDATDYILIDPRMVVEQELAAHGGAAVFSGAQIGFRDKPSNQDGCRGAVVALHYVTE